MKSAHFSFTLVLGTSVKRSLSDSLNKLLDPENELHFANRYSVCVLFPRALPYTEYIYIKKLKSMKNQDNAIERNNYRNRHTFNKQVIGV